MTPAARPVWSAVNHEALRDDAALARVFAAMGFNQHTGGATRDILAFTWPPAYAACAAASPHLSTIAANNRARRDAPVHAVGDGCGLYLIDATTGEWRSGSGAQRGDDLLTLGMLRWSCRYGQAGSRICRAIGIRVPALSAEALANAA